MNEFRREFDVPDPFLYLNHGTHSVVPRRVLARVHRELDEFETNPTETLFGAWGRLWRTQTGLASFIGAKPADLVLRPNVTFLLNAFLRGLRLAPGLPLVTTDGEYGAMTAILRERAEVEKRELITLRLPGDAFARDDAALTRALAEQLPDRVGLLLVSEVLTGTGLRLPVDRIGAEARARGGFLVVDAAHGLGALPADLGAYRHVDLYAANLHKWMMGPKGTGVGWINPDPARGLDELLAPDQVGWTSRTPVMEHFEEFGDGSARALRWLASSSQDFSGWFAVPELLAFWRDWDPVRIRAGIARARATTVAALAEALPDWTPLSAGRPERESPLIAWRPPAGRIPPGPGTLRRLWREHRIQIQTPLVEGAPALRLSPHALTTDAEIVETISRLKRALG